MEVDRILGGHAVHRESVRDITRILRENNLEVQVVKADTYCKEDLEGADIVFSAGGSVSTWQQVARLRAVFAETTRLLTPPGDGTFIDAAALVSDDTPVVGLNTDVKRSRGEMCLKSSGHHDTTATECLRALLAGNYRFVPGHCCLFIQPAALPGKEVTFMAFSDL